MHHLLDRITVDYYGAPTPVNQMAGFLYRKLDYLLFNHMINQFLGDIEKAILKI